ncbi:non-ribosomal peptide synthetase, partial [Gorillibacterium massiliense]|uniref:non-ribosomal peptide synthetase n=1 Tax=Gorillibacterium massiliense TaxID=1280390 RepID=UPI000593020F
MSGSNSAVHNRFSRMAAEVPSRTAISFEGSEMTYGELEERANRLANLLLDHGISAGEPAVIFLEKGIEAVIAMMATFKAGAAYVPLDPNGPCERTKMILAEVDPNWIITAAKHGALLERILPVEPPRNFVVMDEKAETIASFAGKLFTNEAIKACSSANPDIAIDEREMNYIFYTSGTTSQPKGVMGCHKSLAHFIDWEIGEFGVGPEDRVSQLAAMTFDASLRDIWVPLCAGATVCLPHPDTVLNRCKLLKWLESERVTIVHCVPSLFRNVLSALQSLDSADRMKALPQLRLVLMAGEALGVKPVAQWQKIFADRISLINLYGPTETTMVKLFYRIGELANGQQSIPVGKAMKGASALILNENQKLCGIGEMGEIYIRTPYMTLGYYQRPEWTAQVFLQNPLHQEYDDPVYRTGDLGYYLPDGNVEFVGRKDTQIKIRGMRVETGEIEGALCEHPSIEEAAVVYTQDTEGEYRIFAFYTSKTILGHEREMRHFLKDRLPAAMIPSRFIRLEQLPLNTNGKVDRAQLQQKSHDLIHKNASEYIEPVTPTQQKIAVIWQDVLKLDRAGIEDHFFAVGGHSLIAMQVVVRLRESLGVDLKLKDIFDYTTISELAAYVDELAVQSVSARQETIPVLPPQNSYALSRGQERIWFFEKLTPGSIVYSIPNTFDLTGELDVRIFREALERVIDRHETLRTTFTEMDGLPRQFVHEHGDCQFAFIDATQVEAGQREAYCLELMEKDAQTPFDLTTGPLLRVMLFKLESNRYKMYLNIHHIISDGWSGGVFARELGAYYSALASGTRADIAPMAIQFRDYAAWQNERIRLGQLKSQQSYWLDKLSEPAPELILPYDLPKTDETDFAGSAVYRMLSKQTLDELHRLAQEENVSLYMVLLAAHYLLMQRLTGEDDILIGTGHANRNPQVTESLIGFLVNTLVLRIHPAKTETLRDVLQAVKQQCLEAFEHQSYPIDELLHQLQSDSPNRRSSLFSTLFILQNAPMDMNFPGIQVRWEDSKRRTSEFDFSIHGVEYEDGLSLIFEYKTALFNPEKITEFADQYERILEAMVEAPETPLAELILLGAEERALYEALNATAMPYRDELTLAEAFYETAERFSGGMAVVTEERRLTYAELNEASNRVAHMLLAHGMKPGDFATILMERSIETVISLLGVLKAGGVYVPVDPEYPEERIRYMLADSGSRYVLTKKAYSERVSGLLDGEEGERA